MKGLVSKSGEFSFYFKNNGSLALRIQYFLKIIPTERGETGGRPSVRKF